MNEIERIKEKQKRGELLKPKIDVVFHALFREENKDILGSFLTDILKEEVKVITTDKNRFIEIKEANEKLGVMDLIAELEDKTQCHIEIQLKPQKGELDRILYYWSDIYARQVKRGDKYTKLEKVISIVIIDHEIEELKGIENLGTKWQIRDNETGKRVLTEKLEIVIIELPKAIRIYEKNKKDTISQWMIFIDDPNKMEVIQIMKENKEIKKAIEQLEQVSGDEKIKRIAELREKAIRDEAAAMEYAIEKGYEQGIADGKELGREEGRELGRADGIAYGKEQGSLEKQLEIARNMLKKKMNIEDIAEITGLCKEEIKKLM